MNSHILMVDDNVELLKPLGRMLDRDGYRVTYAEDGPGALVESEKDHPDIVIVDVNMPGMDGYEVVRRMRARRSTALVPILFMSGQGESPARVAGFRSGADDFLTKPVDFAELKARVEAALHRAARSAGANPLTGLPANPVIESEISRRLAESRPFAVAYVDIDHFKAYNDAYGFAKGDTALRTLGQVLVEAVEKAGFADDFVGHVGGDDFVLVTSPQSLDAVVARTMEVFDWMAPSLYTGPDRERGGISARDRQGAWRFHPIMRLSVGATSTEKRKFSSYGEVAGVASEMKSFAKALKREGSGLAKDRRAS